MSARKPSLAGLLAKRHAEDEKLRTALIDLKAERDAIDARIREVEALLGTTRAAPVRDRDVPYEAECNDCHAIVVVPLNPGERGSQCPACECSPFEIAH